MYKKIQIEIHATVAEWYVVGKTKLNMKKNESTSLSHQSLSMSASVLWRNFFVTLLLRRSFIPPFLNPEFLIEEVNRGKEFEGF